MRRRQAIFSIALLMLCGPVEAQQNGMLERALASARKSFEGAAPLMSPTTIGVDKAAYGDALKHHQFQSPQGPVDVNFVIENRAEGDCVRFAAYVAPVAGDEAAYIFLCPRFFSPGADALRATTILHEMVHVVAGPEECRAMAYAAKIEHLANGGYQPVAPYWDSNGCGGSRYSLPD